MTKETTKKYFYAKGRRKRSVATVRLFEGKEVSTVNSKPIDQVYSNKNQQKVMTTALAVVEKKDQMYFTAKVVGGGKISQSGAISQALARALVKYDDGFKKALRDANLLTRDNREVERKHTGFKKARKSGQFSKR